MSSSRIDGVQSYPYEPTSRFGDPPMLGWILSNLKGLVLDVGCGDGWLLLEAAKRSVEAVGIEFSSARCSRSLRKGIVVRGDACNLPVRSETFDLVVLTEVLEHLESPYQALREARRVLKKRGTLLLTTPNLASFVEHMTKTDRDHVVGFSLETIINGLRRLGFTVTEWGTDKLTILYPQHLMDRLKVGMGRPYWLTKSLAKGPLKSWGDHICVKAQKAT